MRQANQESDEDDEDDEDEESKDGVSQDNRMQSNNNN